MLAKSGIAQLLGESAGYMAFGSPVTCPACGREIDPQKMIDGAYDVPQGPAWVGPLALAWMVGGPFLLRMKFDWPLGWAIVTPWASALGLAVLLAALMKLLRR